MGDLGWYQHEDLRPDALVAKMPVVDRTSSPRPHHLFDGREGERSGRTHCCAHRTPAGARAVVAQVALHPLIRIGVVLRDAERAGGHAVRAADASGRERALHDSLGSLLDGVGWTDPRADWILAVHAHLRRGLHAVAAIDGLEVDE